MKCFNKVILSKLIFSFKVLMYCSHENVACFFMSADYILKAKSNFTIILYIHFLGIGEWYFKCV